MRSWRVVALLLGGAFLAGSGGAGAETASCSALLKKRDAECQELAEKMQAACPPSDEPSADCRRRGAELAKHCNRNPCRAAPRKSKAKKSKVRKLKKKKTKRPKRAPAKSR